VQYLVAISDVDQPGSGLLDDLDAALDLARMISERVKDHPKWDGADIRVWEASNDSRSGRH
jgi:hypothetical protein